jgi:hypothetical protein
VGQTIPKANYPGLLFASFHFVTMQIFCYNAMQCPVMGVWELGIKKGTNPPLLAVVCQYFGFTNVQVIYYFLASGIVMWKAWSKSLVH